MKLSIPLLLLAPFLAGCIHQVPEHLRIEPSADQVAETVEVQDLESALAAMVRKDPLVRSPLLLDAEEVGALPGGEPLAAWIRTVRQLEQGEGQVSRSLQQLEDEYPSTPAVALARGYRLRLAENRLANAEAVLEEEAQQEIIALLTPLQVGSTDETLPRPALEWLASERRMSDTVRAYGDRWVLTAWLQPGVPLAAVGGTLDAPMYDGLVRTATGALLKARIDDAAAPVEEPLAQLKRATGLALTKAAADRDTEQAEWAELKASVAEELGTDDPVSALLQRSRDGLTAGAAADRATGGALLAIAAMRWRDTCGEPPCVGIDRIETMRTAARWHEEIAPLAAVWQVIALKEALDTMEVGHETVLFPQAVLQLVDALAGTGAGPLEVQLLRRRSPDAAVWLALGRAVGTEGITDWEGARAALGGHLQRKAQEALELSQDPEHAALLERISARAIP